MYKLITVLYTFYIYDYIYYYIETKNIAKISTEYFVNKIKVTNK